MKYLQHITFDYSCVTAKAPSLSAVVLSLSFIEGVYFLRNTPFVFPSGRLSDYPSGRVSLFGETTGTMDTISRFFVRLTRPAHTRHSHTRAFLSTRFTSWGAFSDIPSL